MMIRNMICNEGMTRHEKLGFGMYIGYKVYSNLHMLKLQVLDSRLSVHRPF